MVSALSLDPSGSRLATGSYDNYVKLWDFNGMDMSLKSFRTFEPEEGNQVNFFFFLFFLIIINIIIIM